MQCIFLMQWDVIDSSLLLPGTIANGFCSSSFLVVPVNEIYKISQSVAVTPTTSIVKRGGYSSSSYQLDSLENLTSEA